MSMRLADESHMLFLLEPTWFPEPPAEARWQPWVACWSYTADATLLTLKKGSGAGKKGNRARGEGGGRGEEEELGGGGEGGVGKGEGGEADAM
ncbi:unnamed protein product [Closterium sp. NIES-54]